MLLGKEDGKHVGVCEGALLGMVDGMLLGKEDGNDEG